MYVTGLYILASKICLPTMLGSTAIFPFRVQVVWYRACHTLNWMIIGDSCAHLCLILSQLFLTSLEYEGCMRNTLSRPAILEVVIIAFLWSLWFASLHTETHWTLWVVRLSWRSKWSVFTINILPWKLTSDSSSDYLLNFLLARITCYRPVKW